MSVEKTIHFSICSARSPMFRILILLKPQRINDVTLYDRIIENVEDADLNLQHVNDYSIVERQGQL